MRFPPFLLSLVLFAAAGCAPSGIAIPDTTALPAAPERSLDHEKLLAVLWTQTAVEYRAVTLQTYAAAERMLADALADPAWTALVEQVDQGGFAALPPAVVLDVDETVLDNSVYEARLIRDGGMFEPETWTAWVEEEAATGVPGALAFTQSAEAMGITVVYLTNRRGYEEAATRANLEALGFSIDDRFDAVLTRADVTSGATQFDTSDKAERRRAVAERFRVLALFGDNIGDFLSDTGATIEARDAAAAPYAGWWGTRWFMLPNAQYGSWESTLFGGDYDLTREERIARKAARLNTGDRP